MEQFLSLVGMQAVKLAVRSGMVFTSSYALKQYSQFITTVKDDQLFQELKALQCELENKIKIITPAINLIELRSGQGNSALESAVALTASIQKEINLLGHKIASLASFDADQLAIRCLIADIGVLIDRVNGSIPFFQLAISASGEHLSTTLPDSVSPSRMLQASAFLMMADSQFNARPQAVQVGPDFIVSIYMIFKGYCYETLENTNHRRNGHNLETGSIRKPTWQEVLHKARLRLQRRSNRPKQQDSSGIPEPLKYFYALEITEDREDGRLHDSSEEGDKSDLIPITEISKLIYTNSAAILNIKNDLEACSTPILLLKREINIADPLNPPDLGASDDETQRLIDQQIITECRPISGEDKNDDTHKASKRTSQFPSYLDPEWIALEMYSVDTPSDTESDQSDTESAEADSDEGEHETGRDSDEEDCIANQLNGLSLDQGRAQSQNPKHGAGTLSHHHASADIGDGRPNSLFNMITTSLSLLELVLRLAIAQETQQTSHLSIPDHVLTSFLSGAVQPKGSPSTR